MSVCTQDKTSGDGHLNGAIRANLVRFPTEFLKELRIVTPMAQLVSRQVKLTRSGKHHKGCCPFHDDKNPSLMVYSDRFHCFVCQASGDAIEFVMRTEHIAFQEAVARLASDADLPLPGAGINGTPVCPSPKAKGKEKAGPTEDWRPIVPPPPNAPVPSSRDLQCDKLHTYRGARSELLFYVRRIEARGKKPKLFLPLTYGNLNDVEGWHTKAPDAPCALYGLDKLAARPHAPVMICEGEKAVDAAERLFPDWVSVSWPGGSGAVEKADWALVIKRQNEKIIWPDNDLSGHKAAAKVAALLPGALLLRVQDLDDGADAADVRPDNPEVWLRDRLPPKPVPQLDGFDLTEDGVARAFTVKHAGQLRYCHDTGSWYEWTGAVWQLDRTRKAFHWTRQISRDLASPANDQAKTRSGRAAFAGGVERFAQADDGFAVTSETWDHDPFLLGTPSGTVELRTAELRPGRQADGMTRQTAVAPAATPDCPLWRAFLDQATAGDQELIRFLRQWCGYNLTGDTREHALLFGFGPGGNGKSVFLNTVAGILGSYALTAGMETFTAAQHERHSTELARLRGARMVTASETEEGRAWAETRIKQLTGGDPITARFMRQDDFTYMPQFKLTIIGNNKPILKNVDEAAKRRLNIVPFLNKPSNPDRELETKLKAEWPAILRWMIEGCLDWQRHGLVRPKVVVDATADYFEAQDYFGRWLAERCDLIPTMSTKPSHLLHSFIQWCAENGEPSPDNRALRGMIERTPGLRYATNKGTQWVRGIGIKPEPNTARGGG